MADRKRDLVAGALFFMVMAAFGALILFATRGKWGPELRRERARFETTQSDANATEGLRQLAHAQKASGDVRRRHAMDAVVFLGKAILARPDRADLYAARAEANAIAGWRDAAMADVARAKQLEPTAWPDLEKRIQDIRP